MQTTRVSLVHVQVTSRHDQIESCQVEDARADESRKRGKGPKKLAAKYDLFEPEEQWYLVNLRVSYHKRLESKSVKVLVKDHQQIECKV